MLDRPSALSEPTPHADARAVGLDVLRGLGALAVVILHVSADPLSAASLHGDTPLYYLLPNLITRFAVPAFVLLSGLGLSLSRNQNAGYLHFLGRRVSKILPAYVAWSLIYSWTMPAAPDSASVLGSLRELLTGAASYHLYFVTAILRLYVLYRMIAYLVRRFSWGAAVLCTLSWLMIWLQPMLASTSAGAWLVAIVPLRWLGYFAVGARMAQLGWGVPRRTLEAATPPSAFAAKPGAVVTKLAASIAAISLVLLIVITRLVVQQTRAIEVGLGDSEWLILPYSLGVVVLLLGLQYRSSWLVRALGVVSTHSYGIYLSHVLMLKLASLLLSTLTVQTSPSLTYAGELALGLPLAVIGGVLSDHLGAFFRRQVAVARPRRAV